jgi:hypothetical protein
MSNSEKSEMAKIAWQRAWAGSFFAALVGWTVVNVLLFAFAILKEQRLYEVCNGLLFVAFISGLFVLVVWIAFLLPIYHEVSAESSIWRWQISTILGGMAGYLLMACFVYFSTPQNADANNSTIIFSLFNGFNLYGCICGASTGLFAGLTARYFHADRHR